MNNKTEAQETLEELISNKATDIKIKAEKFREALYNGRLGEVEMIASEDFLKNNNLLLKDLLHVDPNREGLFGLKEGYDPFESGKELHEKEEEIKKLMTDWYGRLKTIGVDAVNSSSILLHSVQLDQVDIVEDIIANPKSDLNIRGMRDAHATTYARASTPEGRDIIKLFFKEAKKGENGEEGRYNLSENMNALPALFSTIGDNLDCQQVLDMIEGVEFTPEQYKMLLQTPSNLFLPLNSLIEDNNRRAKDKQNPANNQTYNRFVEFIKDGIEKAKFNSNQAKQDLYIDHLDALKNNYVVDQYRFVHVPNKVQPEEVKTTKADLEIVQPIIDAYEKCFSNDEIRTSEAAQKGQNDKKAQTGFLGRILSKVSDTFSWIKKVISEKVFSVPTKKVPEEGSNERDASSLLSSGHSLYSHNHISFEKRNSSNNDITHIPLKDQAKRGNSNDISYKI